MVLETARRMVVAYMVQCLDAMLQALLHFVPNSAVIFCNTKQAVRDVCAYLDTNGVSADAIHGDLEQRERDLLAAVRPAL